MKKLLGLSIIFVFALLFTGCGELDDSWNGVYTNGTEYSILLYTTDDKNASIAVLQKGNGFTFYPVNYANYMNVSGNEMTSKRENVKIVKTGKNISLTVESEEKGVWLGVEGVYTKTKTAKSFNTNQF